MSGMSESEPFSDSFPYICNVINYEISSKVRYPSLVISFRPDGNGNGARYDHITFRKSTKMPTSIPFSSEYSSFHSTLEDSLRNFSIRLDNPIVIDQSSYESGLLILPGRCAGSERNAIRTEIESRLIRDAYLRGQPILGLCAGSWQIWEHFGGRLRDVKGHRNHVMVSLTEDVSSVRNNDLLHSITLKDSSFFSKNILRQFPVNSIHHMAVDEAYPPNDLQFDITASTVEPSFEIDICVEAYESRFGAPIAGIQWHPESFFSHPETSDHIHHNVVNYMAKAGVTYFQKRKMIKEFEGRVVVDANGDIIPFPLHHR